MTLYPEHSRGNHSHRHSRLCLCRARILVRLPVEPNQTAAISGRLAISHTYRGRNKEELLEFLMPEKG